MVTILAFAVLGGATAFAAGQLAKNSVGTKQLKKNAVTGAKVKNQTLTGKDIKLSKLGTVPSATSAVNATHAGSADVSSSLTGLENVHVIGAAGEPGFESGSHNAAAVGVNLPPVAFYKDHEGIVHLEGIAEAGTGVSGIAHVFTLPAGFRPAPGTVQIFAAGSTGASVIGGTGAAFGGQSLSGAVAGTEEELVVLSGVAFRAQG
jgi:hypothetical protein